MFEHAEIGKTPRGDDEILGRSEEYIILQDERLIEKAQTYDEATRKSKIVKHRHPEAKVEIQYSGVTVELK
jgi:hypothetical protein